MSAKKKTAGRKTVGKKKEKTGKIGSQVDQVPSSTSDDTNGYSEEKIRSKAQRYAKQFGVEERRVVQILEDALADWPVERTKPLRSQEQEQEEGAPYPLTRIWVNPLIEISCILEEHFRIGRYFLTTDELLNLLENLGTVRVGDISRIWKHFSDTSSPLFDLDEFAMVTDKVKSLLQSHRELAVKHGVPPISRIGHSYLDALLSSYYTRRPREVRLSRPIMPDHSQWPKKPTLRNLRQYPEISCLKDNLNFVYSWHKPSIDSPRFVRGVGMEMKDFLDLESKREVLVDIKIRMLGAVITALRSGDARRLRQECAAILCEGIDQEDAKVFLSADILYGRSDPLTWTKRVFEVKFHKEDVKSGKVTVRKIDGRLHEDVSYREHLRPGGLSAILDLVRFCDGELAVGAWTKTCDCLRDHLHSDIYRLSRLDITNYADLLRPEIMEVLENAYSLHLSLLKRQWDRAKEFADWVNGIIRDELDTSVPVKVKTKYRERVTRELQDFATHTVFELGRASSVSPLAYKPRDPFERRSSLTDYVWLKEGDFWTIVYEGESLDPLTHQKGFKYLSHLYAHPNVDFPPGRLYDAVHPPPVADGRFDFVSDDTSEVPDLDGFDLGLSDNAKKEYEEQLRDLRREQQEARQLGDTQREAEIKSSMKILASELLEHKDAPKKSYMKYSKKGRNKDSISKAIHRAFAKIEKHNSDLLEHLQATVKCGDYFSYSPSSDIFWITERK